MMQALRAQLAVPWAVRARPVSFTAHRCVRAISDTARPPTSDRGDFNELRERSLLRHVISSSTEGDPSSVLHAMDEFWDTYFNGEGTSAWQLRGNALDTAIRSKAPTRAMEIGTYCGYTAVRIGRLMPEGGKLVSIEVDPLFAAIATKVVEHAGLSAKVSIEIGYVADRLPVAQRKGHLDGPLGAILLDHETSRYLPDLQLLEKEKLVTNDTIILCDWSLYPGSDTQAPVESQDFMRYLKERGDADVHTVRHSLRDKDVFTVSSWGFNI